MQTNETARFLAQLEHGLKEPLLAAIRRSDLALQHQQPTREDLLFIRALCTRVWSQVSMFRAVARLASNEQFQPNLVAITV
jgi:hypothetical protein